MHVIGAVTCSGRSGASTRRCARCTPATATSTRTRAHSTSAAAAAPTACGRTQPRDGAPLWRRRVSGAALLRQADPPVDDAGRARVPRRHRAPRPALAVAAALARHAARRRRCPPRAKRSTGRMWASCCSPAPPAGCRRRRSATRCSPTRSTSRATNRAAALLWRPLHVPAAEVCVDQLHQPRPLHRRAAAPTPRGESERRASTAGPPLRRTAPTMACR